jgi:hypothetical protein
MNVTFTPTNNINQNNSLKFKSYESHLIIIDHYPLVRQLPSHGTKENTRKKVEVTDLKKIVKKATKKKTPILKKQKRKQKKWKKKPLPPRNKH